MALLLSAGLSLADEDGEGTAKETKTIGAPKAAGKSANAPSAAARFKLVDIKSVLTPWNMV